VTSTPAAAIAAASVSLPSHAAASAAPASLTADVGVRSSRSDVADVVDSAVSTSSVGVESRLDSFEAPMEMRREPVVAVAAVAITAGVTSTPVAAIAAPSVSLPSHAAAFAGTSVHPVDFVPVSVSISGYAEAEAARVADDDDDDDVIRTVVAHQEDLPFSFEPSNVAGSAPRRSLIRMAHDSLLDATIESSRRPQAPVTLTGSDGFPSPLAPSSLESLSPTFTMNRRVSAWSPKTDSLVVVLGSKSDSIRKSRDSVSSGLSPKSPSGSLTMRSVASARYSIRSPPDVSGLAASMRSDTWSSVDGSSVLDDDLSSEIAVGSVTVTVIEVNCPSIAGRFCPAVKLCVLGQEVDDAYVAKGTISSSPKYVLQFLMTNCDFVVRCTSVAYGRCADSVSFRSPLRTVSSLAGQKHPTSHL
jgi:hypothetical protein